MTLTLLRRLAPLLILAIVMMRDTAAVAGELPLRFFTTADGLGDNRVNRILMDSRGLLWICTNSGVSRFDGSNLHSFGLPDGLPYAVLNDAFETRDGNLWLASNGGGVIRVRLSGHGPRYEAYPVSTAPTSNRVNRLFRGADGMVWAGTDGGLFRTSDDATPPQFERVGLRRGQPDESVQVWAFANDGENTLWVGTRFGLVRVLRDGRIVSYPLRQEVETDHVFSLVYTADDGLLWIGHESGLAILKPPPASSYGPASASSGSFEDRAVARAAAAAMVLQAGAAMLPRAPGAAVYYATPARYDMHAVPDLLRSRAGALWILLGRTLLQYSAGRFVAFDDPRLRAAMASVGEDREGNLWLATEAGLVRMARHGFLTFRESDGPGPSVSSVFENRAGELIAVSQGWRINRFDGERFHTVAVNMPASARRAGWRSNQKALEDRRGDWWFASGAGLVRFSGIRRLEDLATASPQVYTTRDGLAQDNINRLFEDSRGDIWIAPFIPRREVLTRWDRASGRFQTYGPEDGVPAFNAATGFYEARRGVLFFTLRDGGIVRYDGTGFRLLSEADGLPAGNVGGAFGDRAGRMWCWTTRGIYRIDDPTAARLVPVFVATPAQLNGGTFGPVVEDRAGHLYAATSHGVVRIDNASTAGGPADVHITGLYTVTDGLAGSEVIGAYADREGRLWFSTTEGLSYFNPEQPARVDPPQIRIGGVRIADVAQTLSPAGEQAVDGLELVPGRAQLEVAFFGISFATGDRLSYEYRLVGGSETWSAPQQLRSILLANLAPGRYEFEVRALSAGGGRSVQPARVSFRVIPPVWRRWWFMTAAISAVLGAVVAFERYRAVNRRAINRAREERLIELERVRRRIAADLHDEIGSSLTQISILSEVARGQGEQSASTLARSLDAIAASSRELVAAMSDIVWAINPAKDHLADLTQRMRRLAADAFTASNTAFTLDLPSSEPEVALGANVRREVFLIFKESVTNIVKHASCSQAAATLAVEGGVLRLEVRDDGRGFDPATPTDGHGLSSLRNRAAALGGSLTIVSAPGRGTAVRLEVPISTT
jgi:signal transduction histidine kinase/ligand-binding sensor domain-containing protein